MTFPLLLKGERCKINDWWHRQSREDKRLLEEFRKYLQHLNSELIFPRRVFFVFWLTWLLLRCLKSDGDSQILSSPSRLNNKQRHSGSLTFNSLQVGGTVAASGLNTPQRILQPYTKMHQWQKKKGTYLVFPTRKPKEKTIRSPAEVKDGLCTTCGEEKQRQGAGTTTKRGVLPQRGQKQSVSSCLAFIPKAYTFIYDVKWVWKSNERVKGWADVVNVALLWLKPRDLIQVKRCSGPNLVEKWKKWSYTVWSL